MQRAGEDGALRWSAHVSVATDEENDGCEEEDDGREGEGKPESDVLCWVCKKRMSIFKFVVVNNMCICSLTFSA